MALSLQQVQKQTQRLIMTPQMQQSIQLLQLTTIQLEQLAAQEMMENPFLELSDDEEELSVENGAAPTESIESPTVPEDSTTTTTNNSEITTTIESDVKALEPEPSTAAETDSDAAAPESDVYSFDAATEGVSRDESEAPATFDSVDMDWDDYYNDAENPVYQPHEDEEERDFTQYTAIREGFYEYLERQLRLSSLSGEGVRIGEFLIGNLNEDGLFDCSVANLLSVIGVPVELLMTDRVERSELARVVADLLSKKPEELAHLDEKGLFLSGMAELLQTQPDHLMGKSRQELEHSLLARRLNLTPGEFENTHPRERFLLAVAHRLGVHRDQVEDALDIIQEFDPTGVGARDLPECLRLQAEAQGIRSSLLYRIIDNHLKLLQQKKFRELAQLLKCREEDAAQVFRQVSLLEPRPGRSLTKDSPCYITPDVYVKKVDGHYLYYLNEGDVGRLKITAKYRRLLNQANLKGKEREYAMEKLRSATWLIKNIEKRKSTILRVTEAIMNFQREFLEKGIEHLRPLTLREIADVVGMHESTIARVTTGKYVETPRGTYELKFFFSSGLATDDGEDASSRSIKETISQLISQENPRRPLSDQKITEIILQKGIHIARRTVAKYREQLKILPAKLRRQSK